MPPSVLGVSLHRENQEELESTWCESLVAISIPFLPPRPPPPHKMTTRISSLRSPRLLRSLLLVLVVLCLSHAPRFECRRFGFPAKTLHVPEKSHDDGRTIVLEPDHDKNHSGARQKNAAAGNDEETAGKGESRQEGRRYRRSGGSDTAPPKVTIAQLNTTSHKVVVHWAGEGSQVIVALATTILPSS